MRPDASPSTRWTRFSPSARISSRRGPRRTRGRWKQRARGGRRARAGGGQPIHASGWRGGGNRLKKAKAYWAHASAVVDRGAQVEAGTRIWHFCHVMSGARIGARCVLGQNTFVAGTAIVGDGCRIQNNVSIFDGVALDDDVFVGPSAVFTNVRAPRPSSAGAIGSNPHAWAGARPSARTRPSFAARASASSPSSPRARS